MSLVQAINFLKNGDVFGMVSSKNSRFFVDKSEEKCTEKNIKIVDANSNPGLLDHGEWDFFFEQSGAVEIKNKQNLHDLLTLIENKNSQVTWLEFVHP